MKTKKYKINLSEPKLQRALLRAIDVNSITNDNDNDKNTTIIDDTTINIFIANTFNRSNGILIIGSYGKSSIMATLKKVFAKMYLTPYIFNLGEDKDIFLNGDSFCLLNPDMDMELISMLKPSIVILTGIIAGKKSIEEQTVYYEQALKSASVGIIINGDCPEASLFKDINPNTLLYSMQKKADILCKSYEVTEKGTNITVNKDTYNISAIGKDNIYGALGAICLSELLGFDKSALKDGLESFVPPLGVLNSLGTIGGVQIINDSSIYPSQIQKNIKFLSLLRKQLIVVFLPCPDFYSHEYEQAFSSTLSAIVNIGGNDKNNKAYESLAKKLRKDSVRAEFYPNRRDIIKQTIAKANQDNIIIIVGHKDKDFDDFLSNIFITLESKVL